MSQRGRPKLADAALGRRILDNIVERSKPFRTTIAIEEGVGRVVLDGATRPSARR
jgi:hypothetical protein